MSESSENANLRTLAKKPPAPPPKAGGGKQFLAQRSMPKVKKAQPTAQARLAQTVPAPASNAELARALRSNVDLIYEWVHDNVEYFCLWGALKGAWGTQVDRVGGPFDQAALMMELLRLSGYTAKFAYGVIRLTRTQLEEFFGTTETTENHPTEDLLTFGWIPNTCEYDGEGLLLYADIEHVWIKVNLGGIEYAFDPTFKLYNVTAGESDLGTKIGYNQTLLLDGAAYGADIADSNYVQDLNVNDPDEMHPGIANSFRGYGTNLLEWINTNAFAASMADIIGGRSIQPAGSEPLRQTSLPYQQSIIELWDEIPDEYRTFYTFNVGGITSDDASFFIDEIYGKRLTITFTSSTEPQLVLDGVVQATGDPQTEDQFINLTFSCNAPFGTVNWVQKVYTDEDSVHFLGLGAGPCSQSMVEFHRDTLKQNMADGGADGDENVLGESLAILFFMHVAQTSALERIFSQLSNSTFFWYQYGGITKYTSLTDAPNLDLGGLNRHAGSRVGNATEAANSDYTLTLLMSGIEGNVLQQSYPVSGISSVRMIEQGNALGQKIWSGDFYNRVYVTDQLVNYDDLTDSFISFLGEDGAQNFMLVHEDGDTSVGSWDGAGWFQVRAGEIASLIRENISGGATSEPVTKAETNKRLKEALDCGLPPDKNEGGFSSNDPVALFSGNYLYDHDDITVGSGAFPYSLTFSRSYNSSSRFNDGSLGLGWSHNFETSVSIQSNAPRAIGDLSAKEGATTVAAVYSLLQLDLFSEDIFENHFKNVVGIIAIQWLLDEIFTNNVAAIQVDSQSQVFIKLVDETYNPPPGYADTLVSVDGEFTLTSPQQLQWNFDTNGKLATFVDPAGVTVTYTYDSGVLASVSNGLGRTLTFNYTGDRLTSVSDGNGREVFFTIDGDGQLTEFTNAADPPEVYTYSYDDPRRGLITAVFRPAPADPPVAYVTNEYDSLGRVKEQTQNGDRLYKFFLAGSRAEQEDPLGNSYVIRYNSYGSMVSYEDQLGNKTTYELDALNRLVSTTFPELNSVEYVYDNKNNVLSNAARPKPGSSLDDIVQTFEYSSTWNKVTLAVDGEGNETTFEYDSMQGTLLTIERETIGGLTPTVVYTYNERGQVLTRTENRDANPDHDITDKFVYSDTNETLEQAIRNYTADPGDGLNLTTVFGYNAWGDVTSITDPRGFVADPQYSTTFAFDNERRMITRTECSGFEYLTEWIYNGNGEVLTLKRQSTPGPEPEFQDWNWVYLPIGTVKTIFDPAGNALKFQFDSVGRVSSRTDAEGRKWQFQYDKVGRVTTVTDPMENASETRTYTENGVLATITDARGNITQMEYDGFDRLEIRTYPDATTEEFTYNKNSQVETMVTRNGDTITNTYDVLTRLETRTPGSLPMQTMGYDLAGRLTSIATPAVEGDPSNGQFSFGFDTAGRLVSQSSPTGEDPPTYREIGYELDENGNRVKLIWPDTYFAFYIFDKLNRLTDIKLDTAVDPSAVVIAYDVLSRRSLLTYINGCECEYGYALNNDMTSLEHSFEGSSVSFTFGHNHVHQVIQQTVTDSSFMWTPPTFQATSYAGANNLNQYPSVAGEAYSYSPNGNLTSGPFAATFDELNRLTEVLSGGTTNEYWNDPLNRQAQKEVDSTKTGFLYDGAQLIAEYDDSPSLVNRYIPGARLDEILIRIDDSDDTTFFHTDRLGSTIAQTDDSGVVLNKYIYSPFGVTPSLTGTVFGFTGQRYDAEIGLYNYKARYYAPEIGRFLQPDPIGYLGGMNFYTYVGNDALNLTDPLGLDGGRMIYGHNPHLVQPNSQPMSILSGLASGLATGAGLMQHGIIVLASGKLIGAYGDLTGAAVRGAGLIQSGVQAHHIAQHAAMEGSASRYSHETGPAIQVEGSGFVRGTQHYAGTQAQKNATIGGTWGQERQVAVEALKAMGFSPGEIAAAMAYVDQYFDGLGLNPDSPTRVPGDRSKCPR